MASLSKLRLTSAAKPFEKNHCLRNLSAPIKSSEVGQNISSAVSEVILLAQIMYLRRTFLIILKKFHNLSPNLMQNIFDFWRGNLKQCGKNSLLPVEVKVLKEKKLGEKIKFWKIFGFLAKSFRQVCQNSLRRVLENVLKKFRQKIEFIKIFGPYVGISRQSCQNALNASTETFWGKSCFKKIPKCNWIFADHFLARLSILRSAYARKCFDESHFFTNFLAFM